MTILNDIAQDPKKLGNALIGERVHTLMWREKRTQAELAAVLNVDQGSISNRLRGKTTWSAFEVAAVAAWLGVSVEELMPEVEVEPPDPNEGGWGGDPDEDGAPRRSPIVGLRIIRPIFATSPADKAA